MDFYYRSTSNQVSTVHNCAIGCSNGQGILPDHKCGFCPFNQGIRANGTCGIWPLMEGIKANGKCGTCPAMEGIKLNGKCGICPAMEGSIQTLLVCQIKFNRHLHPNEHSKIIL